MEVCGLQWAGVESRCAIDCRTTTRQAFGVGVSLRWPSHRQDQQLCMEACAQSGRRSLSGGHRHCVPGRISVHPGTRPETHTRSATAICGVPLETRKVLLGHTTGDITTHYSAPELRELIDALECVCEQSNRAPELVPLQGVARSSGVPKSESRKTPARALKVSGGRPLSG